MVVVAIGHFHRSWIGVKKRLLQIEAQAEHRRAVFFADLSVRLSVRNQFIGKAAGTLQANRIIGHVSSLHSANSYNMFTLSQTDSKGRFIKFHLFIVHAKQTQPLRGPEPSPRRIGPIVYEGRICPSRSSRGDKAGGGE